MSTIFSANHSVMDSPVTSKRSAMDSPVTSKRSLMDSPVTSKRSVMDSPVTSKRSVTDSPVTSKRSVMDSPVTSRTSSPHGCRNPFKRRLCLDFPTHTPVHSSPAAHLDDITDLIPLPEDSLTHTFSGCAQEFGDHLLKCSTRSQDSLSSSPTPSIKRVLSDPIAPPAKRQKINSNTDVTYHVIPAPPTDATILPTISDDRKCDDVLPTVAGHHSDIHYITPQTLQQLLHNSDDVINRNVLIIDCRYPYEYEGGHIAGAVNIYTQQAAQHLLFSSHSAVLNQPQCSRPILVFHCEFSSERGPRMYRYVRDQDRNANEHCYPQLYYKDMFVLRGGYKQFYQQSHKSLCQPQQYRSMFDEQFTSQLAQYRSECRRAVGGTRMRKSSVRESSKPRKILKF